jgi:nucleotide-binding universal stress UspA family protein
MSISQTNKVRDLNDVHVYETILLPTDGSDDMDVVVDEALTLARLCGAEVHTLHVVDDRAYQSVPEDAREQVRDTLAADAEDATHAVAQEAVERGVDVVRETRWGNPPAGIIAYAEENDIDIVVMGTHGRTGYERYLMGSVAEKVVRAAELPVLTVHIVGDEDEEETKGIIYEEDG